MEGIVLSQYDMYVFQTDIISKVMLFKGQTTELNYVLDQDNKHYHNHMI